MARDVPPILLFELLGQLARTAVVDLENQRSFLTQGKAFFKKKEKNVALEAHMK